MNYEVGLLRNSPACTLAYLSDNLHLTRHGPTIKNVTLYSASYTGRLPNSKLRHFNFHEVPVLCVSNDRKRFEAPNGKAFFESEGRTYKWDLVGDSIPRYSSSARNDLEKILALLGTVKLDKRERIQEFDNANILIDSGLWSPKQIQFELIIELITMRLGCLPEVNEYRPARSHEKR